MNYAFVGFDNTCDLSAVLGILERASVFHNRVQTNAKDVRSKVRNEWGHCNFDHWTELEFQNSFQLMETMVRSLGLPKADEDKQLDELQDWETRGTYYWTGKGLDVYINFTSKIKLYHFRCSFCWGGGWGGSGLITDMTRNVIEDVCVYWFVWGCIDLLYGNLNL